MTARPASGQRVVAVTGGGGGIGAAIAEELGRQGAFVVTVDPLVSLDGTEPLPAAEETTAGRIVAAGGSARASSVSVTDGDAVRGLFEELGAGLDAVVNVAGITRPTSFARGTEEDWRGVLAVHLDGYLNVLARRAPDHGRRRARPDPRRHLRLGVASRPTPAPTAAPSGPSPSLTWQLGRQAPPGVVVNAMSPIAVTRMVTAALGPEPQAGGGAGSTATGGLSLGSMPEPEELGPFGAHLVGEDFSWCSGQVLFAGGSEVAVIDEPRLLEVVRTDDAASLAARARGGRRRRARPGRGRSRRAPAGATPGSAGSSTTPAGDLAARGGALVRRRRRPARRWRPRSPPPSRRGA